VATASNFDWSKITRQTIVDVTSLIRNKVVDQPLTIEEFHTIVSKHVKKFFPVRTRKSKDKEVDTAWIWVGGSYYSDWDQNKLKSIEICLAYHIADKTMNISSRRFNRLCYGIADTILHEVIHMRQYRKRKFKSLPDFKSKSDKAKQRAEQEYLGNTDEIDAYSFNIACELIDKFGYKEKEIARYLNENQQGKYRRHNSWRMYLKAFNHDHNHHIIQRVKKKVMYYLPKANSGRPFCTKDWFVR
jgi:hypothetical protein